MSDHPIVTEHEVRDALLRSGLKTVLHHRCAFCQGAVYYHVDGDRLYFDPSCSCSDGVREPRRWEDAAAWINMQATPEARNEIRARFGMPPEGDAKPAVEWSRGVRAQAEVSEPTDDSKGEEIRLATTQQRRMSPIAALAGRTIREVRGRHEDFSLVLDDGSVLRVQVFDDGGAAWVEPMSESDAREQPVAVPTLESAGESLDRALSDPANTDGDSPC